MNLMLSKVVLQKVVEDRKFLEEGIDYAVTSKISAINFIRFWSILLNPTKNSCMVSVQSSLMHHLGLLVGRKASSSSTSARTI